MDIRSLDRHTLESIWEANERELLHLAVMSPPEREIHAKRKDELLDEQDAIEFRLGFDATHKPSFAPMVRHDRLDVGASAI
jgi:hypothetical protein